MGSAFLFRVRARRRLRDEAAQVVHLGDELSRRAPLTRTSTSRRSFVLMRERGLRRNAKLMSERRPRRGIATNSSPA
jgi:hypothetical protein